MKHEPRVYRFAGNQHFIGSFYAWDALAQGWRRVRRSTGCTKEGDALRVAREWDRVAKLAGSRDSTLTREAVLESLNHILRLAGVPVVTESRDWQTYAAEWLVQRKKKTFGRTAEAYQSRLHTFSEWLGPKRAGMMLNRFDTALLQRFYDWIMEQGRASNTAKVIVDTVGWVFDRAVAEGFAARNPVTLVERRQDGVQRVKEPFTRAEVAKIMDLLKQRQTDDGMRDWLTMVHLGLCTGRRIEDCANAGWQHFETDKDSGLQLWVLRPMKLRRHGRVERIPVVEPLAGHLKALRKKADGLLLCPTLAGRRNLSLRFVRILREAGVKVGKVEAIGAAGHNFSTKSFHSFRHTLTSWLQAAEIESSLRMRIVGHASAKVHEGYTHVELEAMAAALRKVL